eukprot:1178072-Prorocentrum_minimum.AAC.5
MSRRDADYVRQRDRSAADLTVRLIGYREIDERPGGRRRGWLLQWHSDQLRKTLSRAFSVAMLCCYAVSSGKPQSLGHMASFLVDFKVLSLPLHLRRRHTRTGRKHKRTKKIHRRGDMEEYSLWVLWLPPVHAYLLEHAASSPCSAWRGLFDKGRRGTWELTPSEVCSTLYVEDDFTPQPRISSLHGRCPKP